VSLTGWALGIDLVGIDRLARSMARDGAFANAYFTENERSACDRMPTPARAYARTLAVKEAFLKAVGRGVLAGIDLQEVEVRPGEPPTLQLGGKARRAMLDRGCATAHVAWTSDARSAWAMVLLTAR
jgi:phosphopantetheine--protein transferase-like protein